MSTKGGSGAAAMYLYLRPAMAEFWGTFFYVMTGCLARADNMKDLKGDDQALVTYALAVGFILVLLVASFGWVSGGHFNPAVTLAVFIAGGIRWPFVIIYPLLQLLGGFFGALLAWGLNPPQMEKKEFGVFKPKSGLGKKIQTPLAACFIEFFLTLLLVLVYLLCSDEANGTAVGPCAIGLAMTVMIMAHGHTTGAACNTADAFGRALVATAAGKKAVVEWEQHYVFWLGPIFGCLFAALFYKMFLASYQNRWWVKEEAAG